VARHSIHYAAASVVAALVVPAGTAILTRVLAPAEYGNYAIAATVASQVAILFAQWLQQSTNRYLPGCSQERKQPLTSAIGIMTIGMSGAFLVAATTFFLAAPREFVGDRLVYIAAAWTCIVGFVFSTLLTVLQASLKSRLYGIARNVNLVLGYGGAIGLCFLWHRNAVSVLTGFGLGSAVAALLAWRMADMPPLSQLLRNIKSSRTIIKELAVYGAPITLWFVGATVISMSDRYIIAAFYGRESTGIYVCYYLLVSGCVGLICTPIITAAQPLLMKAWSEGDKAGAGKLIGKAIESITLGCVCLASVASLFSQECAQLFLAPAYLSGHNLIPVFILAVGLWQVGVYVHKPLEFAEKTLALGVTALSVAGASILANLLVVPRFGCFAAGWTMLGSSLAYVGLANIQARRILVVPVRWFRLISKIFSVMFVGSLLYWLKQWLYHHGGMILSLSVTIALLGIIIVLLGVHFRIYEYIRRANTGRQNALSSAD
jgi:O-antigen/teichoic acid export membrane protein